MLPSRPLPFLAILGMTVACSLAQAEQRALDHPDYAKVKSLLAAKCYSCHGVLKQKGKLRLDTRNLMLKEEVIVPGKAAESLLIERVADRSEDRMPPPEDGAPLKPEEITLLRRWIDERASRLGVARFLEHDVRARRLLDGIVSLRVPE